ncbi:MAG: MgtC/SapB family protein [Candidatus Pacebacteria bacterium]|nr:MgtC/SapB family protein [Candidatus Paceibacterota bacterium]MCD8507869.1 MgtC/SapB family protein [Candidatus Paceibacterota bacterium]MCD8527943.1 MgtC/SapB family protein [Candidatus Paceibacterota bacterium]MCD8563942.1 MgtC/SapB family protein [Candidatus Paceibacterota bacterium]
MITYTITLLISVLLGLLIGLERTYARKTAGMRTYALVTLAGTLFVVINSALVSLYGLESLDTARIIAAIVSGVGFLGAGLIIFQDNHIANLTTAAGMWVAVAVGVMVGLQLFVHAIIATAIILFVLRVIAILEKTIRSNFPPEA